MKITMIGAGYVGLVSGACFSDFGHEVIVVDKDESKLERLARGVMPIYEPGLAELVRRNEAAGRLSYASDLAQAVGEADAIFIAVGTPSRRGDGFADLSFVFAAADTIAAAVRHHCVVVCKSTVPVGTSRKVLERIHKGSGHDRVEVASNPEFLREGSAIDDFKRPDRVIVGVESEHAREVMKAIYRPLSLNRTAMLVTGLETAELIKYSSNAFLATKITFINEIADLCERVGADVQEVAQGIGLDRRIGPKFLHAGPGYGGSCFPKDTLALLETAKAAGAPLSIVQATVDANDARKRAMAERIVAVLGGEVSGKTVGFLGVTFKPNTDDMRDAPALTIIPMLQAAGVKVRAHDPEGMGVARTQLSEVLWCDGPYHAAEGSDALVILTEWDAYRALDLERIKGLMRGSSFVDLRNVYRGDEVAAAGLTYLGIGRGAARNPAAEDLDTAAE
jgi:UDPglucose 6-dehydrogenase